MRKDEYHYIVIYCKLQQNGYAKCNGGYDCRKCKVKVK